MQFTFHHGIEAYSCGWKEAKNEMPSKEHSQDWAAAGMARRTLVLDQLCDSGVQVALDFRQKMASDVLKKASTYGVVTSAAEVKKETHAPEEK